MKSLFTSKTVGAKREQPLHNDKISKISPFTMDSSRVYVQHSLLPNQQSPSIRPTQCKKSFLAYGPSPADKYITDNKQENQSQRTFNSLNLSNRAVEFLIDPDNLKTEQKNSQVWKQNDQNFTTSLKKTQSEKSEVSKLIQSLSEDKRQKKNETEVKQNPNIYRQDDKNQLLIQIKQLQNQINQYKLQIQKLNEGNGGLRKVCQHDAEILEIERLNQIIREYKSEQYQDSKNKLDANNTNLIEIERLKMMVKKLQSDADQNLFEYQQSISDQKKDFDNLAKEFAEYKEKQDKDNKKHQKSEQDLLDQEHNRNKQGQDQQHKEMEKLLQKIKNLEHQLEEGNQSQNNSLKENDKLKKQIKDLEQQLKEGGQSDQNHEQQLKAQIKENEKLRQSIKDLEQKLRDEISKSSGDSTATHKENDNLQKHIKDLEQQLKDAHIQSQHDHDQFGSVIETLKQTIKQLQSQSSNQSGQSEHELDRLMKENDKLISSIKSLESSHQKEIDALNKKIQDLLNQCDADQKEITQLNKIIDDLERDLKDSQMRSSEESSETTSSITYQKNEVEVWKKKFTDINKQFYTIKEQVMLLEAENQALVQQQKQTVEKTVRTTTLRTSKGSADGQSLRNSRDPEAKP